MKSDTYFQSLIWTCQTCGFIYQGGQPKMECPVCASYKANFVDLPQNLEQEAREAFPKLPPNHQDVRAKRLELMKEHQVAAKARVKGRMLPGQAGEHIDHTSSDALK